jgi:membrane protein implicated in regulation of membrane protease activity
MSGFAWWAWMILAGVLGLAEMHVPGAYLVWIALGAALTGAADAAFGLSLEGQLGVFAAASALSCAAGYFVYRRLHRRQRGDLPLNERHRSMLGERGTVCEAFVAGRGKVRLGDSVWLAAGPDLAEGAPIVVSGVRGTRLVVEGLQPRPSVEPAAGPATGS